MVKGKYKFLGVLLAGVISVSSISGIMIKNEDTKVVYAAESKELQDAKAKISHLTKSLKTNYLGLKNQGTWEMYIKQARELIKKIPLSESDQRHNLTDEVNKDEALVKALARINQVEKSMTPKEAGGYGNALIPANVPQWQEYIRLANVDLEKVNKTIFENQYNELINRRDVVNNKLEEILKIPVLPPLTEMSTVYYLQTSDTYHRDKDCSILEGFDDIKNAWFSTARKLGKTKACEVCAK